MKLNRTQATLLFILILLVAKLSEPDRVTEPPPEQKMIWTEGDRILTAEGFMDLPKSEREKLIKNLWN